MASPENSCVPLRHSSLPGIVRLPKRYKVEESRSLDSRKGSIDHRGADRIAERLSDLNQALLWIKQELILLRQHDILLKRQFCDIHDTIVSLNKAKRRAGFREKQTLTSSNTSLQSNTSFQSNTSIDITLDLENYGVRSANSVTLLNEEESEDEDEIEEFRPRTCSMKTTRDLTALARRRGSKELI
ncbi:uncharacterized protein LOC117325545 [Pecten maximus]|uniref:uncharacterized protein LOC117325545 n=1 Tax=Pecten maximus TaxID=6579 RepID=UPI00145861ED|nr:uncharacterized protein LOC117325545 [Pecten maximus]XP_033737739.1 uncharacterized protein LOC117325545 [Pecten maximus]XP_033737740.1 uncharacterized protein LOC117325545 [Pecten maximus]XP_033737741.1 uncharacterized protein LOC117325545 [Pecten maximus]XP_033737742.1 uncharacterized protein LOC117325545 [Pecten maximus]